MSQVLRVDGLIVDRGGELVIAAPSDTEEAAMADFVREKKFRLYRKLAEKETLQQPSTAKEFVSGEGFPCLGRSHRLLLVPDQEDPLKLPGGRFLLQAERLRGWVPGVGLEPRGIGIRDLGFRWGSCSRGGTLNFHWATILLPPSVIDYVIVHELVHRIEPNHTPLFWQNVARVLPDYGQHKTWLAEKGGAFVSL